MVRKKTKKNKELLVEAIETFSSIAELELTPEQVVSLPLPETVIAAKKIKLRNVEWLHDEDRKASREYIRSLLAAILSELKKRAKNDSNYLRDPNALRGVKTIMMLVGEAAKKLDLYTRLFDEPKWKSATELPEYKALNEFYQSHLDRKIDENILSRWILGLANPALVEMPKPSPIGSGKRKVVDLESVKKDREYELLLMRKEDGSQFFNPRLLKNLKLVSDFGGHLERGERENWLQEMAEWRERSCLVTAQNILKSSRANLEHFYKTGRKWKAQELNACLDKACMALMLAAHPENLSKRGALKNVAEYFFDFQVFLREALKSRYYQRLLLNPPSEKNVVAKCLVDTLHSLCRSLFLSSYGMQELNGPIDQMLQVARSKLAKDKRRRERGVFLWSRLAYDYAAALAEMRWHPNGPLTLMIDFIENKKLSSFDSIFHYNLPNRWFDLHLGPEKISHLRVPSPTRQLFINQAVLAEEFKGFILSKSRRGALTRHLLINLQDKTGWREHARASVLESLQGKGFFSGKFIVATLAVNTPFYHQEGIYEKLDSAKEFIAQLMMQIGDENAGFYFPEGIKERIVPLFSHDIAHKIHEIFYQSKKSLNRFERIDFISMAYLFLSLKMLDLVSPDSFSFSCKDAIDEGGSFTASLFALLLLVNRKQLSEAELEYLNLILYGPPVLVRGRLMFEGQVNRVVKVSQLIEREIERIGFDSFKKRFHGAFDPLFKKPLLHAEIELPYLYDRSEELIEAA